MAGGDQGVHVDGPAALADLLGDRVDPHERARGRVSGRDPNPATISSSSAPMTDTCDLGSLVTRGSLASFSTRRVDTHNVTCGHFVLLRLA